MSRVIFTNSPSVERGTESGFALTEFLIAACVLLIVSAAAFGMLVEIQRMAGYESEVQAVLDNTRIAMQVAKRYIQQAGNDPLNSGLTAITVVSPTEVRIQSDVTGSAGPRESNKGDPDGDIDDSGENITIRFNDRARRLEIVPSGGSAQIVANYISEFSLQYFNASGGSAAAGEEVYRITVTLSGASVLPDPQTRRPFSVRLSSDVRILT
jgi:Tfp pilus assembly protein PilW